VPRQRRAAPAGEQPESLVQAGGDLIDGEALHARRGQLERERQPIEPAAHLRHGGGVALRHAEAGLTRGGALLEQTHRLARGQPPGILGVARIGERQRRHAPNGLARDAERLAAGREHAHVPAGPQQRLGQRGAGRKHVLAVVED